MNGTGAEKLTLKYLTIQNNETVQELLRRAKFEVSGLYSYSISTISPIMGKGVRVISLVNSIFTSQVKLEVYENQVKDILEKFKKTEIHNKPKKTQRMDGLDDIEEFFE